MGRLRRGVPMPSDTRAKMVAGAADLMSRRGVNATSMRDVVRHTGTPRGSIGHHFPRGKQQLIEDALVFAGSAGQRAAGASNAGAWRDQRTSRLHRPVAADAGAIEIPGRLSGACGRGRAICQRCDRKRRRAGRSRASAPARSGRRRIRRLASHHDRGDAARGRYRRARPAACGTLFIASLEGTVAMCRAARSVQPLDDVRQELELVLSSALPK